MQQILVWPRPLLARIFLLFLSWFSLFSCKPCCCQHIFALPHPSSAFCAGASGRMQVFLEKKKNIWRCHSWRMWEREEGSVWASHILFTFILASGESEIKAHTSFSVHGPSDSHVAEALTKMEIKENRNKKRFDGME